MRHGFSLVEILVGTGVMVAVILPIMFTFTQSVRLTEVSLDEIVATNLAEELADQILLVPYVAGMSRFPSYPVLNAPVDFPNWGRPYGIPGCDLPSAQPGLSSAIDTKGFTLTGVPYPQDETPPQLARYLRLYLSPLPERFQRKAKVHPVLDRPGALDLDLNMMQVSVEVSWEDRALAGPHPKRTVTIRSVVSNPTFGWGGL